MIGLRGLSRKQSLQIAADTRICAAKIYNRGGLLYGGHRYDSILSKAVTKMSLTID